VLNDEDIALILNDHFISVGRPDDGVCPNLTDSTPCQGIMSDVKFDALNVFKQINKLKINSSPGPDNIPFVLLKHLKQGLCHPLAIMYECIFKFGQLPTEWKYAIVKPLFKKGCSSDPGNYIDQFL